MAERPTPTALAVLGPTASGKSALAMQLAARLGAEIVCCDSAQVYRGLDIGSAKPTPADRAAIPHHLLDVVEPSETFHAGAWSRQARDTLNGIASRGRIAVVVGGTGLYYRALTRGLFEAPPPSEQIRARHRAQAEADGLTELYQQLVDVDPTAAAGIRSGDLVRISRALEIFEQTGIPISEHWKRAVPREPLSIFCVLSECPPQELRPFIERRVDFMMNAGLLDEVRRLHADGYGGTHALRALGYRELGDHLRGQMGLQETVAAIKKNTVAYAKRQRTFFRQESSQVRIATPFDGGMVADLATRFVEWRDSHSAQTL